ncbi:MAG: hypothetical protein JWN83_2421 [Chitinophagaceae bacterium]|nr:hypothetical protein [Chitinophagaceae bacterium]
MKTLISFFVSTLFVVSGFAQYGQQRQYNQYGQTVTINFNGNGNANSGYQVIMDGTTYSSRTNNNGTWNRNTSNRYGNDDITINNIQPGQHSIQVYRIGNNNRGNGNNRNYGGASSPVYSSTFNLRQGYDVMLDIKNNGKVQFSEQRSNNGNGQNRRGGRDDVNDDRRNGGNNNGGYNNGGYNNGGYRAPMADYQFSQIYQDAKGKWFQANKVTAIKNAFNNTVSYFSTYQITQLLQLITSESNRLELAKLSYRVVSDPTNFTQVYSLFSSQSSRNDLDRYVRGNRF